MIDFFTDPYKDELIYSAIARYHFYSGNADFKDTIEECFGKRSMASTFELGGRLDYLVKVTVFIIVLFVLKKKLRIMVKRIFIENINCRE